MDSVLPHRHPSYIAGSEWCERPDARGNPHPVGSDDYAMFQLGVQDRLMLMRAKGETAIEEIAE